MTTLLARAQVETLRFGGALRQYWKRIVLGGLCGWIGSSVLGALFLVWVELAGLVRSEEAIALLGAAIVWSGIALGGLVAYAMRPHVPSADYEQ